MTDPKPIDARNVENRLAAMQGGQDRLEAGVEALRGSIKSVQIMLAYLFALAVIVYLLLARRVPR